MSPLPPPSVTNITPKTPHPHNHYKPQSISLPDIFFTAFSLLYLFSSTKSHHLNLNLSSHSFHQYPPRRRLFLKNPIMSPSKHHHPSNPNPFSTPQSLFDWLQPRLPSDSFTSWGTKPGTKNIHNLWLELSEGESSLEDSIPPIRSVHVVTVRIVNGNGEALIEAQQELSDGTFRERFRPLSEKMKPGETVEAAVLRAVKEELGSILGSDGDVSSIVKVVPGSYQEKVETKASVSYPGLPACYILHSVEACVDGLPNEDFCTVEEGEYGECSAVKEAEKAVSVKKHFWKWVGSSNSD